MSSHSIGFKPASLIKNMDLGISFASTVLILIALVLFGAIGGAYLVVAGATASATQTVNQLNENIVQMGRANDQLLSDIAYAESLETIEVKAQALGFVPTDPSHVRYMEIRNLPPVTPKKAISYQFSDNINQDIEPVWYDPIIDFLAGYNH